MIMRILLLLSIFWIIGLSHFLACLDLKISGRDLILILGGLFLLIKSTTEIHSNVVGSHENEKNIKAQALVWY